MKLDRLFGLFDQAFRVFSLVVLAGGTIGGGFLAWGFLGMMEVSLLAQLGGTLIASLIAALLIWVTWTLMKLFA